VGAIELIVRAGAVRDEKCLVAIAGFDARELGGHGIQGFIPRDALEFALTAFASSFEGMKQPFGVVLAAQVGPSARAGAQLRGRQAVGAVISVQAGDAPIFNMGDQQAAATAVVSRASNTDFGL
jgi:hypothetical protein